MLKKHKYIYIIIVIIASLTVKLYFLLFPPFQTQTIMYRNKDNRNLRVEFQMQDMGAFGYNRRTVIVEPGTFFDTTKPIDVRKLDKNEWVLVDEEVNELHIIFP